MKPSRTLVLKKETLVELSTDELRGVVGGELTQQLTPNCPTRYCASTDLRCMFSQYMDPCVTDLCP